MLRFFFCIFYFLFFISIYSCEENPIIVENKNLPLNLDTLSFNVTKTINYKVEPAFGNLDTLFFGEYEGFKFHYSLIGFDTLSEDSDHSYNLYKDSLIVDSAEISLKSFSDTLISNQRFNLRYFPNFSDSVFNESEASFKNFTNYSSSSILSSSSMMVDSSDTTVMLKFVVDTEDIEKITGTNIDNFNMSFIVETSDKIEGSLKFHSSETISGYYPRMKVFYKNSKNDTINFQKSFRSYDDITIIEQPAVKQSDTANISLGYAKGLKSLVYVELDDFRLPDRGILKKAELILNNVDLDSSSTFTIDSYPIESTGNYDVFNEYNDDPYGVNFTFMTTSNTVNGEVKLNHRSALREISKGSRVNYGFKVESSPVNNLFKSTSFHSLNSKDLFPVMRVIYAIP